MERGCYRNFIHEILSTPEIFFYGMGGGFKACPVCKIQIKGFYLFQLSFGQKCAAGPTTYQKQTVSMYINYTWPNPAGSA